MNKINKLLEFAGFKKFGTKQNQKLNLAIIKKTLKLKKDILDARDYIVKDIVKLDKYEKLPPVYTITRFCTDIKSQGGLSSCGAFSLGAAYEVMRAKMNEQSKYDVSELFIYYNSRSISGTVDSDSGIYLRDGCKAMQKYGSSLELAWPYLPIKFSCKPSILAYLTGRFNRIESYYRCCTIKDIKLALSKQIPVISGIEIYSNFLRYEKGIYNKISGNNIGGHAMLVVGYDDTKNAFLIRNSWGLLWGEKGYCWISYDIFEKCLMDAWAIVPFGWG
ncbi:MAG: C1 family peptidase [Bacteroidota bacterium]